MILSIKAHLKDFLKNGYIKNVNKRELDNSEGVGLDLTVNKLYIINDEIAFLGKDYRKTPSATELLPNKDGLYEITKKYAYLVETKEVFDLPMNIFCRFYPRSTLFRSGIQFQASILSHGYNGPMIFSINNTRDLSFFIEKGARFSTAVFELVDGESNPYAGQWNGGRVFQKNSERQV
ncbi:TPA: hypothetical protein ACKP8H_002775 [Serratia marcescens]|uniref:dCTP deaminase domain-containing protein n=1 Tax=Serratia marcescens TaxID=615 RepID=UPI0009495D62|nr:hypothetical protein [Serratia marcescens]MBH2826252.1 hypothetical protein [Serratia marcescens]MBH3305916.1 hypothetical protein [Serratia marcescens]